MDDPVHVVVPPPLVRLTIELEGQGGQGSLIPVDRGHLAGLRVEFTDQSADWLRSVGGDHRIRELVGAGRLFRHRHPLPLPADQPIPEAVEGLGGRHCPRESPIEFVRDTLIERTH